MQTPKFTLSPALYELAQRKLVLIDQASGTEKRGSLALRVSRYDDVPYLISDLLNTCIRALGNTDGDSSALETQANVAGVLAVILDLLPYEEFELLDALRDSLPKGDDAPENYEYDLIIEQITLTTPSALA